MDKIIEPSLLSIHKDNANAELNQIKKLGIKYVHYDVMDEKFIGHASFKTEYLKELNELGIYSNVHLMVAEPMKWIKLYQPYKINAITFHCETQGVYETKKILDYIHSLGFKAGIAIKMGTDLNNYQPLINDCDIITIMSVEPGLGGQKYNPECMKNLLICQQWKKINSNLRIQIDGGIDNIHIKELYDIVDNFVTGSWFFKNINYIEHVIDIKKFI